jgi:hypothetical protein
LQIGTDCVNADETPLCSLAVDFWGYYLYAYLVLVRAYSNPYRERNKAAQGTNAAFLRTTNMEVPLLKERASQLACPSRQGAISLVENMFDTNAVMTERNIVVLAHKSGEQNV